MLLKVCFFLSCFLYFVRLARCRRGSQFMMIEFLFSLLRPNPKCNIFSGKINKVSLVLVLLSESDIHEEKSRQYIYPIRYSGHMRSRGGFTPRVYLYSCLCRSFPFPRSSFPSFKDSSATSFLSLFFSFSQTPCGICEMMMTMLLHVWWMFSSFLCWLVVNGLMQSWEFFPRFLWTDFLLLSFLQPDRARIGAIMRKGSPSYCVMVLLSMLWKYINPPLSSSANWSLVRSDAIEQLPVCRYY